MKTFFTIFYSLLISSSLFAQIQITSNDVASLFAPGKAWYEYSTDSLRTTMNVGSASGTSQIWTVPGNIFHDTTVQINISPANTPYANLFPNATHSQYWYSQIFPGITDTQYAYYRITPDTLLGLGGVSHITGTALDTTIIDKKNSINAIFPIYYGEKYVAKHDSVDYGGGVYIVTTRTINYDAFGTITFPDGTFDALRETSVNQTDTFINNSLSSSIVTHDFSWITKAHGDFYVNIDTSSQLSNVVTVYGSSLDLVENYPTAVNESASNIPGKYELFQNYPNPFNPSTTIGYRLPEGRMVTLKVYDILGREVATLVNEYQKAGEYKVRLSADKYGLSSGVYFYRLTAGSYSSVKKMIFLK